MSRFKEKDLPEILQEFQNQSTVELEFENNLSGNIVLKDVTIKYDEKIGFINIDGKDVNLKINTTLVYSYEIENRIIKIELESLVIYIKKIEISNQKYEV